MFSVVKKGFWLFGLTIFLLIVFLPGYTKLQELREKNRELATRIRQLKVENILLEQELRRLETDPVYQEKIARDKMGVVRKGEVPIKIVPEKER